MAKTKSAAARDRDERPSRNGQTAGSPSDKQDGAASGQGGGEGLDGLSRERLHEMLYQMLLGRRFEEKTAEAYAIGKIGGFCHLYIG